MMMGGLDPRGLAQSLHGIAELGARGLKRGCCVVWLLQPSGSLSTMAVPCHGHCGSW